LRQIGQLDGRRRRCVADLSKAGFPAGGEPSGTQRNCRGAFGNGGGRFVPVRPTLCPAAIGRKKYPVFVSVSDQRPPRAIICTPLCVLPMMMPMPMPLSGCQIEPITKASVFAT
jgi:hypothetical protein